MERDPAGLRFEDSFGETAQADDRFGLDAHRILDSVFQLPYIARPVVLHQLGERILGKPHNIFACDSTETYQCRVQKQFDVAGSFTERGNVHGNNI